MPVEKSEEAVVSLSYSSLLSRPRSGSHLLACTARTAKGLTFNLRLNRTTMIVPFASVLSKAVVVGTSFLLGAFYVHWLADHPLIWQGPAPSDHAVANALRASLLLLLLLLLLVVPLVLATDDPRASSSQATTRSSTTRRLTTPAPCRPSPPSRSSRPSPSSSCRPSRASSSTAQPSVRWPLSPYLSPAPLKVPLLTLRPAPAVLLLSALTVYTSNVLAALRFLPLDALPPSSFFPSIDPVTTLARVRSVAGGNLGPVRLVEALQSVAASHMIIAVRRPLALSLSLSLLVQHALTHSLSPSSTQVSLTGVLAIQGAQGWAERPSSTGRPVPAVAPAPEAPKEAAR